MVLILQQNGNFDLFPNHLLGFSRNGHQIMGSCIFICISVVGSPLCQLIIGICVIILSNNPPRDACTSSTCLCQPVLYSIQLRLFSYLKSPGRSFRKFDCS